MLKTSPLAPDSVPDLPSIPGISLSTFAANIKYQGRDDLMLCTFEPGTTVAGVLTRSGSASAPVLWCREALGAGGARGLVVNSGNANTFTGEKGAADVVSICETAAGLIGCDSKEVFIASTGVIGEPLPVEKITDNLPQLQANLSGDHWQQAAAAIMTTDTFLKVATRTTKIGDTSVTLNGMAKGSGMIEPDMATMLSFLGTDAAIPADVLHTLLAEANAVSFNAITVDSDTSTSDTCLLFASGSAGNRVASSAEDPELDDFRRSLTDLMTDLATQVVRDGEGASKLIAIQVAGAESNEAARRAGKVVANSPLVKTAIAGEDANWGRIVMAIGKSGETFSATALKIRFGGIDIVDNGARRPGYDESEVTRHLQQDHIEIDIDLGVGSGAATVWTCDLTHGYIEINADYRS